MNTAVGLPASADDQHVLDRAAVQWAILSHDEKLRPAKQRRTDPNRDEQTARVVLLLDSE
jgi:hypothetical protein